MDFRILGPLEVHDGEREVRVRGGKQRALLALLLVNANRTLAIDRIVDDLWGEDVPDSAHKMVQIHVSKLRRLLAPGTLHTRPPGYALQLDPDEIDLHRFEQLVAGGRADLDAGRAGRAAERFRDALGLWRGPALAEFGSEPFAQAEGARLEEVRTGALEGRLEAELQLGRHADVAGELEALVARYPLREGFRRQQILALYRSGRQADALAAYQDARRVLADELGIEPSPALRELERRILRQDASLDLDAPAVPSEPEPEPAPEVEARPPEEMLKLVTVLFADVLAPAANPEELRDLLGECFAVIAPEIEAEGGTAERLVGGGIMAVFGVPAVHEDDPVRAVRAARRIVERVGAWNDGLEVRVGVSTGEALASGDRVTSDAIAAAARLRQAAGRGTIVVAERTARAVRAQFELRPDGSGGWVVEAEREEPADAAAAAASPFVGRDHELDLLRSTLAHVRLDGRPALVTLVGDAGVGKSRLVRELLGAVEGEARVLVGRCLPLEQGVTLWPLAEMLKVEAGVLDTDRPDDAAAKLAGLVERTGLAGEEPRTVAALASTLGLRLPADPLASLDPRELYHELVAAWLRLLASMARGAPVVAVVEDVHWADPTMLDVLDELAERLDGPVLLLCTARPDLLRSRPDWGGGRRNFSSLPLDPLSGEESARLVAQLPGVAELPDGVRRLILERAGGNPFFLEEIVRWRADVGIEHVEIPDNVQAVILARLDLLAPDERRVAQRAAVVGRVFWDGALAGLGGVDDLDAALRTLRRREFVLERLSSSLPGQREYSFKHVLIRDVAYASLPRAERGRAHAETATWIERTTGERTDELAELLAHHYDAAYSFLRDDDFRRRARAYLLDGAASANRRFAVRQGDRLARRAVELSEGAAERVESLEALGDLQYLAFLGDAAWRTYVEALAELADDDPAVARLAGKATLFSTRFLGTMQELPEADEVRAVVERGLAVAPAHGHERTLLLVNRGFLIAQREDRRDPEAEAAVRAAAASAEELGDPDLLSAALDLVATYEENLGRYGEAYRNDLRRNRLLAGMRDVKEIGDALAVAARAAFFLGRLAEAEEHATACIERARGLDAGSYLHGLSWRLAARFALGEWDDALADQAELERVAAVAPGELPPAFVMGAYTRTALCRELRGERDEADRCIALALRSFAQVRHTNVGGSIHRPPLALALARQERFDEALAIVRYTPRSLSGATMLEALCEIAAARGAWHDAPALVAAARDEAEVGEQLGLPPLADRLEGRATGDPDLLERSAEGFGAHGARWDEARSRLLLAEAVAGTDPGRAERELAASLPLFEALGAVREVEQARALLTHVAVSR